VPRPFEPGQSVALRDVWNGRVWNARPVTIVEDRPDQLTLFIPAGARWMAPHSEGRRLKIPQEHFDLVELSDYDAYVLSFSWPGIAHAVLLFFRSDWTPWNWYVNLEEPLRRTGIGFDTLDHELDAIVELDGSWRWKDEDELAEAIRLGVIAAEDEPRLRAEGERAVQRILEREPPFDRDWTTWRPDPSWPLPELPHGWDRI
jgi:hypothetical protein